MFEDKRQPIDVRQNLVVRREETEEESEREAQRLARQLELRRALRQAREEDDE